MATTPITPTPSAPPPGASAYDRISALTSGVPAQFTESDPAPSEPTPDYGGTPAAEVTPPVETTSPASTESTTPAQAALATTPVVKETLAPVNPYEAETVGTEIPQAILDTFLTTPQGKEIVQNHRALSELAKPIEQGGIGHIPTTQQARDYYLAYRDFVMMNADINSGNPQQLGRFLGHVFNPQRGEEANVRIANQIPGLLAESPALYTAVMEPFLKHYQDTLMERFKQTKGFKDGVDDREADALWFAASILNNDLNGAYLDPPTSQNGAAPAPVDPKFAAEKARFESERQAFEQQKQQSTQAHQTAWTNTYNAKVGELLMSELDQALAPLKAMYANAPVTYNALRRQYHDEIVAALNSNRIGMDLHNTNLRNAYQAGTVQSAHAVANGYRDMARDLIRANRKRFLEGAGVSVLTNNQQRHSEAALIDQNRAPGGGGGVSAPAQNGPITKDKDEGQSDFILRMVKAATGGAARNMVRR